MCFTRLYNSVFCFFIVYNTLNAQDSSLTLTLRGDIIDQVSQSPIPNAQVLISNDTQTYSSQTDSNGHFTLRINLGIYTIELTHNDYYSIVLPHQEIYPSQSSDWHFTMKERIEKTDTLSEVLIIAKKKRPLIGTPGVYHIDIKSVQTVIGNRNDPMGLVKNLPSVAGNGNRGVISIRGGAPWALGYRIEGMYVLPPIHFSNIGITGSSVTMLNDNNIQNFEFHIGSFDAQIGNALGGVADLSLRNGNQNKVKGVTGMSWNGLEIGLEGPFSKHTKASYLISYRYGIVGMLAHLGLVKSSIPAATRVIPHYQDLSFKIHIPTAKAGTFSFWGIGGPSAINFPYMNNLKLPVNIASLKPGELPSKDSMTGNFSVQVRYLTILSGMTHTYHFNKQTYGKFYAGLSFYHYRGNGFFFFSDKKSDERLNYFYRIYIPTTGYYFYKKIDAQKMFQAGASIEYFIVKADGIVKPSIQPETYHRSTHYLSGHSRFALLKGYYAYKHYFTERFYINTGLFTQMLTLNYSYAIEPRFMAEYALGAEKKHVLNFTSGIHSQIQPLDLYFFKGNAEQNQRITKLKLNKSFQTSLSYNYFITPYINLQLATYYHYHFDIAVDDATPSFSILNTGSDFFYTPVQALSNRGKGKAYGIEFMLNATPARGMLLTLSAATLRSFYAGSDGKWHPTFFDIGQKVTFLIGKEWILGAQKRYKFNIGTKISYNGGNRVTPFLETPVLDNFLIPKYDQQQISAERLPYYFSWDGRIGLSIISKKVTHNFYVEYWNISARNNIFLRQYNPSTQKSVYLPQIRLIPILFYRLHF